jgi:hypothetical protein
VQKVDTCFPCPLFSATLFPILLCFLQHDGEGECLIKCLDMLFEPWRLELICYFALYYVLILDVLP